MKSKKRVQIFVILITFSILLTTFTLADITSGDSSEDTQLSNVDRAYACLENQLGDNCAGTKSTKTASFNLLAGAYDSGIQTGCKDSLMDKLQANCWSETDAGACTIKSTALAILALEHIGEDTEDYVTWLLDKRLSNTGLVWYMQIDSNNKTECDINGKTITVENNKKITGTAPPGLAKAYSNYWFKVDNIDKNYTISCDKDFIVALSYQKPGSNIYYITSETETASEYDSLTVKINSFCFSTSNTCDYEGSLWATLALTKTGEEKDIYIPYLTAFSDESTNRKYIPSTFLYILTSSNDYYDNLIDMQKTSHYWDESRNKFFDTALVLLSLEGISSNEAEAAKRYLLEEQQNSGCWPSDTNFILYSAWPKSPFSGSGGDGGVSISYCEDFSHYCVPMSDCNSINILDSFYCSSSIEVCCENPPEPDPTCLEQGGVECDSNEECVGTEVIASDSNSCCVGDCEKILISNACEDTGYDCRNECGENYEPRSTYDSECDYGEKCCEYIEPSGSNWWLIILLIILIILVILAIIFRNQLKVWMFKRKSGYKEGKVGRPLSRPGPPGLPMPNIIPKPSLPPRRPPARGRPPSRDKEFEETMKKLRDMSK